MDYLIKQFLMLLCVSLVSAKMLNIFKNPTAEELYRMVLAKKVTYEEIRRIDANKFVDLELTMRMLYDHSSIGVSTQSVKPSMGSRILNSEIPPPNASMREPQKPPAPSKQKKGSDNQASLSTKTRKREAKNQTTKKAVDKAEKVAK